MLPPLGVTWPPMRWHIAALPLLATFAAVGCSPAPINVVDYHGGQPPHTTIAPRSETYTLMADGQRVEAITLAFGENVGFARQGQTLQAVAGDQRIPLADGNYAWVIEQPRFKGIPVSHTSRSSPPPNLTSRGSPIALGAALATVAVIHTINAAANDP